MSKFTLYPRFGGGPPSDARPRVAYMTGAGARKFISADGVPRRKLIKLVNRANKVFDSTSVGTKNRFLSGLGNRSGEYSDAMFELLMRKKIRTIGKDARRNAREKLRRTSEGALRTVRKMSRKPRVSRETTPFNFFNKTLRGLKAALNGRWADVDEWDARTRSSVKEEIQHAMEWLGEMNRRL